MLRIQFSRQMRKKQFWEENADSNRLESSKTNCNLVCTLADKLQTLLNWALISNKYSFLPYLIGRGTAAGEETTVPSDLGSSQTSGPAQPRNLRFPSVKTRVIRTGRFGRNGTRNFCGWNIVSNGMRCFATPADYFLTENPRRKCFALLESANGTLQGQSVSKACAVSWSSAVHWAYASNEDGSEFDGTAVCRSAPQCMHSAYLDLREWAERYLLCD
jgi:hypothetical protein